jgi:bifunctional non-homologous end joining protein LigD
MIPTSRRARQAEWVDRPAERVGRYAAALRALERAGDDVELVLDGARVAITHLDKVLWTARAAQHMPSRTRRDQLRYLLQVAPVLLAHVRDRPLTLIRQPGGIDARRFVHFHYEQPLPAFVETIDIWSEKARKAEPYLLCNNAATLAWLAHVGALEIHPWHSRGRKARDAKGAGADYAGSLAGLESSVLNRPDFVVCDLDPYLYAGTERPGAQPEFNAQAWSRCKEVALSLKFVLDAMGVRAVVKTSGKTGLHVLVPIVRTLTYDATRAIATILGRHVAQRLPRLVTLDQRVSARAGRIFFDYGMNARVKTLIAPYSPRGVPGAPVAMPIDWSALPDAMPLDFTIDNVPRLLERYGDLWADVLGDKQDLARIVGA